MQDNEDNDATSQLHILHWALSQICQKPKAMWGGVLFAKTLYECTATIIQMATTLLQELTNISAKLNQEQPTPSASNKSEKLLHSLTSAAEMSKKILDENITEPTAALPAPVNLVNAGNCQTSATQRPSKIDFHLTEAFLPEASSTRKSQLSTDINSFSLEKMIKLLLLYNLKYCLKQN